ncbi:MAG: addiction module protein [Syntrophobacteraceae bacterium]|nr:addiction module protein [Syntrophobacteraceae bacterium]
MDDLSEVGIEALWVEEAERRLDEMELGQVSEIPAEEALRKARKAIS